MNLLAIDTSTDRATVALQVGTDKLILEQDNIRQHAQMLLPMIEQLLVEADCALSQLNGIIFGRGPGSFTGLRIACSIAKALAFSHNLPLYPVSGLAAIAFQAFQQSSTRNPEHVVLSVIDARMNQLYWGVFSSNSFLVDEQVSSPQTIVVPEPNAIVLAGVQFAPYQAALSASLTNRIMSVATHYPSASAMIDLVTMGQFSPVSVVDAEPVYIRNQVTQGAVHG